MVVRPVIRQRPLDRPVYRNDHVAGDVGILDEHRQLYKLDQNFKFYDMLA